MLIVEFDGPPSWSLDASETGESTKFPWVVAVGLKAWGFWRQNRSLETQNCMVFEVVNPYSWIFNAISSEKICLISMPSRTCSLYVRTVKVFPPAES